ncbi:MAG: nuclear transport factor 2 family protein [Saprospiraceae bacterium]|nr:nuclear transport factor 2 family protein [Saprospiraceae bacterium]
MQKEAKQHIEALLNTYQQSLNSSDPELAQSLYTRDGVFIPSEAPSAIGTEQIGKSYTFIFSQIRLNIAFFIEEIVVDNHLAFATTTSQGTALIHATGQTVPEENRELFVFEKVQDQWKIARYMFNKMSSPQ